MNIDNFNGKITKQVINSRKLDFGKKIRTLTISDLHGYTDNSRRAERLAEAIKRQEPDIIFIAGDIFGSLAESIVGVFTGGDGKQWEGAAGYQKFRKFIDNVSEVCPVAITWGNHDIRGMNEENQDTRIKHLRNLENVRPGSVLPLYNDRVIVNGMEIIGYVPSFDLMENEGMKTQIHGIAHDKFIEEFHDKSVKFENKPGVVTTYLGHDPHLIAASENGVGLGDLSVCDYFITGHLHDGYKALLSPFDKAKKAFTGAGLSILEFDKGLVEQPTGVVDKDGKLIEGSKKPLGPSNLCRGIVYFDDESQQKIWQSPDGKFYKNAAKEPNVQVWQSVLEETARKEILDNNLHFMLISEGISPSFLPKESRATMNVVDIEGVSEDITRHK